MKKFYMIRVQGGEWDPRRKIKGLAKAMDIAYKMAVSHGKEATVIKSVCSVAIVDGKPVWTDQEPES